jgi:hypothetical protein
VAFASRSRVTAPIVRQQGGETKDRVGAGLDLHEPVQARQIVDARQQQGQHARIPHQGDRRAWVGRFEQLQQFLGRPLAGET